jgi:hypothetical protein
MRSAGDRPARGPVSPSPRVSRTRARRNVSAATCGARFVADDAEPGVEGHGRDRAHRSRCGRPLRERRSHVFWRPNRTPKIADLRSVVPTFIPTFRRTVADKGSNTRGTKARPATPTCRYVALRIAQASFGRVVIYSRAAWKPIGSTTLRGLRPCNRVPFATGMSSSGGDERLNDLFIGFPLGKGVRDDGAPKCRR